MAYTVHPIEEFRNAVQALIGLPVSLAWKGFGSAVFLELGRLTEVVSTRKRRPIGEACISVEWDWRVEERVAVLFGSSNSRPEIEEGLRVLQDASIQSVSIEGQVPELVVCFSNGLRLRSMVMTTGDPQWSIKLTDGNWLFVEGGSLRIGEGPIASSEGESAAFALAEATATRWGVPVVEPKGGDCSACSWFVFIDGEDHLLDYGVCIASDGPLDGHVVNRSSGCPRFTADEET